MREARAKGSLTADKVLEPRLSRRRTWRSDTRGQPRSGREALGCKRERRLHHGARERRPAVPERQDSLPYVRLCVSTYIRTCVSAGVQPSKALTLVAHGASYAASGALLLQKSQRSGGVYVRKNNCPNTSQNGADARTVSLPLPPVRPESSSVG